MTTPLPSVPFYLINAFSPEPHQGNTAAVVLFPSSSDPRSNDKGYMQYVARDFNFSATAFLTPSSDNKDDQEEGDWGLRWFTPIHELTLCGHGTIASSQVLTTLNPKLSTIRYKTKSSGELTAKKVNEEEIEISLPSFKLDILPSLASSRQDENLEKLSDALGLHQGEIIDITPFDLGVLQSFIVLIKAESDLGGLKPDFDSLLNLSKGLIIVSQINSNESEETLRTDTRVFAPGFGVDEDTVNGSGHAYLTGYLLASPATRFLPAQFQQNALATVIEARHLSSRGGGMNCIWDNGRVRLIGISQEFARGLLSV